MLPVPLTLLILMLKINSWMQSKVPQIKLKVLQSKIKLKILQSKLKFKVRQLKVLQTTMLKLVKMYPCSLCNNWPQHNQSLLVWWCLPLKYFIKIGLERNLNSQVNLKKMQNHIFSVLGIGWKHTTFPTRSKSDVFYLTLTGEARLWYESLAPLDNDWPALQNKFRWQYSKIGNTPKQLFHTWRTFKFDENTDTIDSYILRMSQVAAMLNYGEMQILENFKNTLPYQPYSTLINVNNLRDAIVLAKRVLMKEKLDRLLTGQSSTPFMRATSNDNYSVPTNNKRGVTFDAMETLERNIDCIDKLASLVSDMKMTIDWEQSPYKPRIYQGRARNQNSNQQNFTHRNRSFSRGRNQSGNRGNYNYRHNYRTNYKKQIKRQMEQS